MAMHGGAAVHPLLRTLNPKPCGGHQTPTNQQSPPPPPLPTLPTHPPPPPFLPTCRCSLLVTPCVIPLSGFARWVGCYSCSYSQTAVPAPCAATAATKEGCLIIINEL